jgi:hypothetical protein
VCGCQEEGSRGSIRGEMKRKERRYPGRPSGAYRSPRPRPRQPRTNSATPPPLVPDFRMMRSRAPGCSGSRSPRGTRPTVGAEPNGRLFRIQATLERRSLEPQPHPRNPLSLSLSLSGSLVTTPGLFRARRFTTHIVIAGARESPIGCRHPEFVALELLPSFTYNRFADFSNMPLINCLHCGAIPVTRLELSAVEDEPGAGLGQGEGQRGDEERRDRRRQPS